MPERDDRIVLWRNTIQLFYQYNRPGFVGPFKAAGFKYNVEPLFLSSEQGANLEPDIVASCETGWLILELTTQPKSKELKLDRYRSIDPRDLSQYGLFVHDGKPDVMTSRLSDNVNDGSYCQITVDNILKIEKEDYLHNQRLKDELIKAEGTDLRRLPEIPIAIIPEMAGKWQEIRRGLIEIVMQIFDPNSDGKTPVQLVDDGLERLSNKIRPAVRSQLISKVINAMEDLIQNHLSEYLELKDGRYIATKKFKTHHKTMEFIALRLKEWAGISQSIQLRFKGA
ncbi:MAG: hypothetical protein DIAAKJNI_00438 [Candidatus Argoarchaeum ethanivorans]|uniref:Uncharacterized protein n=1 Tax=Candidatus Argoarchaeum ethanivorans TaxID=2608793 RepID=A0A811TE69_9EURY|nr:MAG: hypothetical protein DIAAKJNI_00438 [Candidatus Argoarchaeum ethanivorans]